MASTDTYTSLIALLRLSLADFGDYHESESEDQGDGDRSLHDAFRPRHAILS